MPRRRYGSLEELRRAVAEATERLREQMGQGVLQGLCVGTYEVAHEGISGGRATLTILIGKITMQLAFLAL